MTKDEAVKWLTQLHDVVSLGAYVLHSEQRKAVRYALDAMTDGIRYDEALKSWIAKHTILTAAQTQPEAVIALASAVNMTADCWPIKPADTFAAPTGEKTDDQGAGLIHQTIPDVAGTEAHPDTTDDASPEVVLSAVCYCASLWENGVRLLGNIRATDIQRSAAAGAVAIQKLKAASSVAIPSERESDKTPTVAPEGYWAFHELVVAAVRKQLLSQGGPPRSFAERVKLARAVEFFDVQCTYDEDFARGDDPAEVAGANIDAADWE